MELLCGARDAVRGIASACSDNPLACADPSPCPLPLMPCTHRHPDKNANSPESTEMFQKINAACESLNHCILACITCYLQSQAVHLAAACWQLEAFQTQGFWQPVESGWAPCMKNTAAHASLCTWCG